MFGMLTGFSERVPTIPAISPKEIVTPILSFSLTTAECPALRSKSAVALRAFLALFLPTELPSSMPWRSQSPKLPSSPLSGIWGFTVEVGPGGKWEFGLLGIGKVGEEWVSGVAFIHNDPAVLGSPLPRRDGRRRPASHFVRLQCRFIKALRSRRPSQIQESRFEFPSNRLPRWPRKMTGRMEDMIMPDINRYLGTGS